ncbi:hypothetical protein JCM10550A_15740 [Methanogenium cariaci]|jgi:hypothetical protein
MQHIADCRFRKVLSFEGYVEPRCVGGHLDRFDQIPPGNTIELLPGTRCPYGPQVPGSHCRGFEARGDHDE